MSMTKSWPVVLLSLAASLLSGCATTPVVRVDQGGPQARLVGPKTVPGTQGTSMKSP